MSLNFQQHTHDYSITSYDERGIQIQQAFHTSSLLLSFDGIVDQWQVLSITDVVAKSLQPLLNKQPELLLLGTGEKQVFPDLSLFHEVLATGIGLEVMTTKAACRTFNVLLSENRKVAAALILENA